ncbi:MAG: hypothetical protein C0608_05180 [Deltaproteobacteria bacterium]|nr:MAG: hypothetical protein C0608_05180 [Deltaproteobacteria bacterium]
MHRIFRKVEEGLVIKLDQQQLIAAVTGIILVGILTFLVGVLVGRMLWGSAASVHEPTPGIRVVTPAEKIAAEPVVPEEKTPPPVDMTFYEGSSDIEPPLPKEQDKPIQVPEKVVEKRVEHKVAQEEPAPKPKPSPPPAPKPVAKTSTQKRGGYTVQLNSFKELPLAERMVKTLSGEGVTAMVNHAKVDGRSWYRVQSGSFDTREKAEKYKRDLAKKGIQGYVTGR